MRRLIVRLIIMGIIVAGGVAGVFHLKSQQMARMAAGMAAPPPPVVIAAVEASLKMHQPGLDAVGSLVAVHGVEVSAEVAGIVSEILFQSGQAVEKGEALVHLEDSVTQAALGALEAEQHLANIVYQRKKDLFGNKVISKSDFDVAEATWQVAVQRVKEQHAKVAQKTIRAPFSGLLGIRQVDQGQYVGAGVGMVPLQMLDPIFVDFSLPERYLPQLAIEQAVEIRVDAFPEEVFLGQLTAINPEIQTDTRSVKLRATVKNSQHRLHPGMFARLRIIIGKPIETTTIPKSAISYNPYGDYIIVLTAKSEGKWQGERRSVTVGETHQGWVTVLKGLKVGEQVVRAGMNKLRPGAEIVVDNSIPLNDAQVDHP